MGRLLFPIHSPVLGAGDKIQRGMAGGARLRNSGTANIEQRSVQKRLYIFMHSFRHNNLFLLY